MLSSGRVVPWAHRRPPRLYMGLLGGIADGGSGGTFPSVMAVVACRGGGVWLVLRGNVWCLRWSGRGFSGACGARGVACRRTVWPRDGLVWFRVVPRSVVVPGGDAHRFESEAVSLVAGRAVGRFCRVSSWSSDGFEVESVSPVSVRRCWSSGYRPTAFSSQSPVPCRAAVGIKAHAVFVAVAEVSAAIDVIHSWRAIVEQGRGVDGVNRQKPPGGPPQDGAEEVSGRLEEGILPVVENATQVGVTVFQIHARGIACRADVHQIVQVDLVGIVVLLVVKVQLIRHLVCEKPGPVACLFVGHGVDAGQSRKECYHQSE